MSDYLDIDTAMKVANSAFVPLGCLTAANPDGASFSLTVLDAQAAPILSVEHVHLNQFSNPVRLGGVIEQVRQDLARKGYELSPWTMPWIIDPSSLPETPPNY